MGFVKEFRCLNGHSRDVFEHKREDVGCTNESAAVICAECGHTMGTVFSPGHAMLFFEEGRTRMIENLDVGPTPISSYAEYEKKKKERGVENYGALKGGKGRWV